MLYVHTTKVRISRSLDLDVPHKIEEIRSLFLNNFLLELLSTMLAYYYGYILV